MARKPRKLLVEDDEHPITNGIHIKQLKPEDYLIDWDAAGQDALALAKRCRKVTPQLLGRLYQIAMGPKPDVAVKAITELMNRGWGKAVEQIELSGKGGGPILIDRPTEETPEQWIARVRAERLGPPDPN